MLTQESLRNPIISVSGIKGTPRVDAVDFVRSSHRATETIFKNIAIFIAIFRRRLFVFTEQIPIFQEAIFE